MKRAAENVDKLPPHSVEAEQGVLACCLLSPLDKLNECEEAGVRAEWFYDVRHQHLWQQMVHLHLTGNLVDVITLRERLKSQNLLEEIGGDAYLGELPDTVPSAANLSYYLDILREKWTLRQLLATCVAAGRAIYEGPQEPVADLVARVEREVLQLTEAGAAASERRLRDILQDVMAEMDDYHRGRAQLHGMTTGLEYVDKLLCGIGGDNGNYIVISGRPGTGKTSLALQIMSHLACDYVWFEPVLKLGPEGYQPVVEIVDGPGGRPLERFKVERRVGISLGMFSLEMAGRALVQRLLFQRAGADMQRWRTGFAENEALPVLTRAAGELHKPEHVLIDDIARLTIDKLRAKARRWHRQYGIRALVVDYIQLLRAAGKRFREDRVQELSEISAEIAALGKELNIPIIVLAQMNRDYEKEPTRQPRLSDLKDCGSIEQDADLVGFLYTPKLREAKETEYKEAMKRVYGEDWSKHPKRVNLLFAKARYGPTGNCELLFQKSSTKFHDYGRWLKENGERELAKGDLPMEEPE